jgi:3-hydroxyisobutyrate dehydrogenase
MVQVAPSLLILALLTLTWQERSTLLQRKSIPMLSMPPSLAVSKSLSIYKGVLGAENATLTFMLGNKKEQQQNSILVPILQKMGKNIVHCGDSGNGLIAKICNNMLLAITMVGTSEALALGKSLGMDPKLLTSIINTSTGRNWSCDTYNPVPGILANVPASKDYAGGFKTTLITKDLQLAMQCSYKGSSPVYLGGVCHQIYNQLSRLEETKEKDFSIVYQLLDMRNKGK